jgi:hypothetical protein
MAGKGSRQKSRLISIRLSLQDSSAPLAQVLRHPQQQALQQPLVLACRPQQAGWPPPAQQPHTQAQAVAR